MQATDRQQVRKPGVTHRLCVAAPDRTAVATGQRGSNRPGRSAKMCQHFIAQSLANPPQRGRGSSRGQHRDRPAKRPSRSHPGKPCRKRVIVAARQHRWLRRFQPSARDKRRTRLQLCAVERFGQQGLHQHRTIDPCDPDRQQQPHLRTVIATLDNSRGDGHGCPARHRRHPDQRRFCPDRGTACREHQRHA